MAAAVGRAVSRELGRGRRDRRVGPADRRDEGAAHRGRRRGRRGAVGARRGRGGGGVADRPLRRLCSRCSCSAGTQRPVLSRRRSATSFPGDVADALARLPHAMRTATAARSPRCAARSRSATRSSRTSRSRHGTRAGRARGATRASARASRLRRGRASRASFPSAARARLPGVCVATASPASARATASALSSPATRKRSSCVVAEARQRQRDPVDERLVARLGADDVAAGDVERGEVREERRDMAVRAEAEQDEVEGADVRELELVLPRALVAAELALHAVDGGRLRVRAGRAAPPSPCRSSSARRRAARSARLPTRARRGSSRARARRRARRRGAASSRR